MRNEEMDFLPASYRLDHDRRKARHWSLRFAAIIGCGILMTEGTLRLRLQGLRGTRDQAGQQAESALLRSTQIDSLRQHHQALIDELAKWSGPLETKRATEVLDIILDSRPPSMLLQQVEWNSTELVQGTGPPTLRISGVLKNLSDIVPFVAAVEEPEGLPHLEIRQSGISNLHAGEPLQTFVIESVADRGVR